MCFCDLLALKNMEEFISAYKSLYKAMTTPETTIENLQQLLKTATSTYNSIEKIITDKGLPRSNKYSLETSLAHFINIKHELCERIEQGGKLEVDNNLETIGYSENASVRWSEINSAFKYRIKTCLISNVNHLDFNSFMDDAKILLETQMKKLLRQFNVIKVNTALVTEYVIQKVDKEEINIKQFNTRNISIFTTTQVRKCFEEDIRQPLDRKMSEFEEQGSGWSLKRILYLTININKYNPMRASCYIPLPEYIQRKKACINV